MGLMFFAKELRLHCGGRRSWPRIISQGAACVLHLRQRYLGLSAEGDGVVGGVEAR